MSEQKTKQADILAKMEERLNALEEENAQLRADVVSKTVKSAKKIEIWEQISFEVAKDVPPTMATYVQAHYTDRGEKSLTATRDGVSHNVARMLVKNGGRAQSTKSDKTFPLAIVEKYDAEGNLIARNELKQYTPVYTPKKGKGTRTKKAKSSGKVKEALLLKILEKLL